MTQSILICSLEERTREALKKILSPAFPLIVVSDADQCLAALTQKVPPALAFVGTSADEEAQLFEEARKLSPKLTVIVIGEDGSEDAATSAVSRGATGYTMPPLRKDDILAIAQKTMR